MKWRKLLIAACVLPFLGGCVSAAQRASDQKAMNDSVPVCRTQKQCDADWQAAIAWVSQRCGMKIQTQTDTLIQTYNSPLYSPMTACTVNRVPGPGHSAAFTIRVGCANIFGCQPSVKDQVIAFGEAVRQAGAPFEPLKIGVNTAQIDSHGQQTNVMAESVGVKITEVLPGGRASAAGLLAGDVVKAFDDARIRTQDEWTDAIEKYAPGDVVVVHIRRAGQDLDVSMPL